MTRGRVCRLQLLLIFASAVIFRSESRGTYGHILLSQIRDSLDLEGQIPVFMSPRDRVAQLYRVPFSSPSTNRCAAVEVFGPTSTRVSQKFSSWSSLYILGTDRKGSAASSIVACLFVYAETFTAKFLSKFLVPPFRLSAVISQGNNLGTTIYTCYSWEMALNFGLDVSFDNM
jgi:hypothetical protein